ncbi:hypothetical protein [Konateibacter massiliensis]|nr:hypothetical protein [Konateibacter massiliensis]
MKVMIKMIAAVIIFLVYYIVFCAIEGIDMGDPWKKLMKWAKS